MKKKIGDILVSILFFFLGLSLLFWTGSIIKITSIVLGVLFIIYGITSVINYVCSEYRSLFNLLSGIISIVIGVLIISKPNLIAESISFVIGIFIIIVCISSITSAIENKNHSYKISLGLSISGIVIGVLCALGKILIPNIMIEFVGVCLIVFSVLDIINAIIIPRTLY